MGVKSKGTRVNYGDGISTKDMRTGTQEHGGPVNSPRAALTVSKKVNASTINLTPTALKTRKTLKGGQ